MTSFATGTYTIAQKFNPNNVFQKWENDEQVLKIYRLEKENQILRENQVTNPSLVTNESSIQGQDSKAPEPIPEVICTICHRVVTDCDSTDFYYSCDKFCKKVFCAPCQNRTRQEFVQHPQLAVQKMAYYKNFEKINESFNDDWQDQKCNIF